MALHVPELARDTTHYQLRTSSADGNNGLFRIESPNPGWRLVLIVSDGGITPDDRWEHVSVHARDGKRQRIPTWTEMCYVKRLCWDQEDCVMQLHPREAEYVNVHPCVLHLWRPVDRAIPTPPIGMVG
jgi:hypothetical protein